MIKNECKIVRDLFPNYIEEQVSYETKEFVENHLKNCKECTELLNSINEKEKEEDIIQEEREINFLKKYNENLIIAKTIIIFLLIIIVSSIGVLTFRYASKYHTGKKAYSIIQEVYNKTEEFKKYSNLTLEINGNGRDIKYSYKDGYLKEERIYTDIDAPYKSIVYGRYGEFSDIIKLNDIKYIGIDLGFEINNNFNTMYFKSMNGTRMGKHDMNEFYLIDKLKEKDILECSNIKVIETEDFYILEEYNGKMNESTYYISKENMLLEKYEEFDIYRSNGDGIGLITNYKYSVNTLTDEDVILKDLEKYGIDKTIKENKYYSNVWECYTRK